MEAGIELEYERVSPNKHFDILDIVQLLTDDHVARQAHWVPGIFMHNQKGTFVDSQGIRLIFTEKVVAEPWELYRVKPKNTILPCCGQGSFYHAVVTAMVKGLPCVKRQHWSNFKVGWSYKKSKLVFHDYRYPDVLFQLETKATSLQHEDWEACE